MICFYVKSTRSKVHIQSAYLISGVHDIRARRTVSSGWPLLLCTAFNHLITYIFTVLHFTSRLHVNKCFNQNLAFFLADFEFGLPKIKGRVCIAFSIFEIFEEMKNWTPFSKGMVFTEFWIFSKFSIFRVEPTEFFEIFVFFEKKLLRILFWGQKWKNKFPRLRLK